MIQGAVNDAYEAVVALALLGPAGQSQDIEAVTDTAERDLSRMSKMVLPTIQNSLTHFPITVSIAARGSHRPAFGPRLGQVGHDALGGDARRNSADDQLLETAGEPGHTLGLPLFRPVTQW